ncbi:MAG: hypothetical protein WB565_10315 [Acidimicrobiales bacterium]
MAAIPPVVTATQFFGEPQDTLCIAGSSNATGVTVDPAIESIPNPPPKKHLDTDAQATVPIGRSPGSFSSRGKGSDAMCHALFW